MKLKSLIKQNSIAFKQCLSTLSEYSDGGMEAMHQYMKAFEDVQIGNHLVHEMFRSAVQSMSVHIVIKMSACCFHEGRVEHATI